MTELDNLFSILILIIDTFPFILILVAFLVRMLACRGVSQSFDSHGHLYFAKELKAQKQGPFGSITTKVIEGVGFSAPFLWHWIIGLIPLVFTIKYQRYWNPIIDSLFAISVYAITLHLGYPSGTAILAYLLYLFTPMWFSRLAVGPRVEAFTPRLTCEIVTNLFFVVVCLPIAAPYWFLLLGGGILAGFVLASAKFGVQTLLFVTPMVAIFTTTFLPLAALLLGILIVAVASKGAFLNSLRQQFAHLHWYFLKNLKGGVAISNRNHFGSEYLKTNGETFAKYLARLLATLCFRNSFTGVFIKLPVLWVSLITVFMEKSAEVPAFIWAPVLAGCVLLLVINIPQLLFLGEAERYLNHVAYFIILLGVTSAITTGHLWLYWGLVLYGMLYLLVEVLGIPILEKEPLLREKENKTVIKYLSSLESSVVLCFPYHAGGGVYRVMANTPHHTIFLFATTDEFVQKLEKQYTSVYPYADLTKLDKMREEFGVNILIVRAKDMEERLGFNWKPSSSWIDIDLGLELHRVFVFEELVTIND